MLDHRILEALAAGPATADELAAQLGADVWAVRMRLGYNLGTTAVDGGVWRLAGAGPSLAYLSTSARAVADGLRRQGA